MENIRERFHGKEHGEIDKRRRLSERGPGKEQRKIDKRRRISERGPGKEQKKHKKTKENIRERFKEKSREK